MDTVNTVPESNIKSIFIPRFYILQLWVIPTNHESHNYVAELTGSLCLGRLNDF
jgi:hypothetical protein